LLELPVSFGFGGQQRIVPNGLGLVLHSMEPGIGPHADGRDEGNTKSQGAK